MFSYILLSNIINTMGCGSKGSCSSCNEDIITEHQCGDSKNQFIRKRILIICTGNSCRSQMAEGWLQSFDDRLEIYSAGTHPEKIINPFAVNVMAEVGIDISFHYPKSIDKFVNESFDYLITVCDNAKQICPSFAGEVKNSLHIGFEDPADAKGNDKEITEVYRKVRDQIRDEFYKFFINL